MKTRQTKLTKGGVLLVEDDPCLRKSLVSALEGENYEVYLATAGEQAAQLARAAPIDILVVDLTSQSLSQWHLFVDLAVNQPHLRTVVISGGLNGSIETNHANGCAFLGKPLDPARVVAAVNALLAARRAGMFRSKSLQRETTPIVRTPAYREWGLND
jgi:DNA-binding response OmpR family regulator